MSVTIANFTSWKDQWTLVGVGMSRIQWIYRGRPATAQPNGSADAVFDLHAFFVACFHFKDWLIQDGVVPKNVVEDWVNQNGALTLCADLANRTKHYKLTRVRTHPNAGPTSQSVTIGMAAIPTAAHSWVITAGPTTWDALQLAQEAVSDWTRLLKQEGLIP